MDLPPTNYTRSLGVFPTDELHEVAGWFFSAQSSVRKSQPTTSWFYNYAPSVGKNQPTTSWVTCFPALPQRRQKPADDLVDYFFDANQFTSKSFTALVSSKRPTI